MDTLIKILLQNIGTFSITMFGISVTIFTVVYSFIVSKKVYYHSLLHMIKSSKNGIDTRMKIEKELAFDYIKNLKKLNLFVSRM